MPRAPIDNLLSTHRLLSEFWLSHNHGCCDWSHAVKSFRSAKLGLPGEVRILKYESQNSKMTSNVVQLEWTSACYRNWRWNIVTQPNNNNNNSSPPEQQDSYQHNGHRRAKSGLECPPVLWASIQASLKDVGLTTESWLLKHNPAGRANRKMRLIKTLLFLHGQLCFLPSSFGLSSYKNRVVNSPTFAYNERNHKNSLTSLGVSYSCP